VEIRVIKGNWRLEQITVRSTDVDTGKNSKFFRYVFRFR
jgi:hypothetical protein